MIDDVFKALDRIPIWKRLQDVPSEVDDLKHRVADLEEKISGKWSPDICKFCGARAARLHHTSGPTDKGKIRQEWKCLECKQVGIKLA